MDIHDLNSSRPKNVKLLRKVGHFGLIPPCWKILDVLLSSDAFGILLISKHKNYLVGYCENSIVNIIQLFQSHEVSYSITNINAPNDDNPDFFVQIFELLEQQDIDHKMIGGDFNTLSDPKLDRRSYSKTPAILKAANIINSFIEEGWYDVWRAFNPEKIRFTWKRMKPLTMSRLDYFLFLGATINMVTNCKILANSISNHSFVLIKLETITQLKGKGFWKWNTSFLKEKEYLDEINEMLDHAKMRYENLNKVYKWEMIKLDVQEISLQYGQLKAQRKKAQKQKLQNKLKQLEQKLACINSSSYNSISIIEATNIKIDRVKQELDQIANKEIEGVILRAKARWVEQSEKSTKYFFQLEKTRSKNKVMSKVETENGIITDPKKILQAQSSFYKNLYTTDPKVNFTFDVEIPNKISEEDKRLMGQPITVEELGQILKSMPNEKTPGPDGICADFYKVFWYKIKDTVVDLVTDIFEAKRCHPSGRRGVISLIPKRNRNMNLLKSWRLICLLCADYKLISKTIAGRIKVVLNHIIHEDQTGFVKKCTIADSLRKNIDTLRLLQQKNINALLISIDFEKAFDRVEYSSLLKMMKLFNFHEYIIVWVKILFTDMLICTQNNGYSSEYFSPSRGLFQGNPISSFGFITMLEALAIMMRSNQKIEGIRLGKLRLLLNMFADDLTIVIQNKRAEWLSVKETLDKFQLISGLKINYDKSTVYRVLSSKTSRAQDFSLNKLKWTDKFTTLGIVIARNDQEMFQENLEPTLNKAEATLNLWRTRGLGKIGRVALQLSIEHITKMSQ